MRVENGRPGPTASPLSRQSKGSRGRGPLKQPPLPDDGHIMPISATDTVTSYDAEMMVKAKKLQQVEGQNALRLIESAAVRSPETERMRHPDATVSVLA